MVALECVQGLLTLSVSWPRMRVVMGVLIVMVSVLLILNRANLPLLRGRIALVDGIVSSRRSSDPNHKQSLPKSRSALVDDIVSAGFSRSLFFVDSQCPRYLLLSTEPGGLGHRFAALVYGIVAANATKSTLVLPKGFLAEGASHSPTGYVWFSSLLRARDGDLFLSEAPAGLHASSVSSFQSLLSTLKDSRCNRTITVAVGHRRWCGGYCVNEEPEGFRQARPLFAMLPSAQDSVPEEVVAPIRVAWHVRVGDQVLLTSKACSQLVKRAK